MGVFDPSEGCGLPFQSKPASFCGQYNPCPFPLGKKAQNSRISGFLLSICVNAADSLHAHPSIFTLPTSGSVVQQGFD